MSTLLSVSIAILAGLLMTRVLKPLKLPDVTAYLIAGVLVGPYCLGALGPRHPLYCESGHYLGYPRRNGQRQIYADAVAG